MLTTVTLILAAGALALLAVGMGWVLGWASRAFHVEIDPKIEAINVILPGANCGGCGFVGCGDYAEAIVQAGADVNLCAPGGASCARRIAEVMGVEVTESWPYKAIVHCSATWEQRLLRRPYFGEQTCAAANLVAGVQGCTFGCLGLGDCVEVCDYDAIHMVDGLAVVDEFNCVGCKVCAKHCPRNIITIIPWKAEQMLVVGCSNEDFGKDVSRVCTVGCIGCQRCVKDNPHMAMEGNLPVIRYEDYDPTRIDFDVILESCNKESLVVLGRPTAAVLAAVADEEVPERIEADFKTTVDDTEWRG
jgi:electron transport complex protein RnfB